MVRGGVGWKESRGPPFNYLDPLRKDCVHEANVHTLQPPAAPKAAGGAKVYTCRVVHKPPSCLFIIASTTGCEVLCQ